MCRVAVGDTRLVVRLGQTAEVDRLLQAAVLAVLFWHIRLRHDARVSMLQSLCFCEGDAYNPKTSVEAHRHGVSHTYFRIGVVFAQGKAPLRPREAAAAEGSVRLEPLVALGALATGTASASAH